MARELLENKIANICALVDATVPPKIFLTGKGNFREKIATIQPYKGNRDTPKPFHYNNLRAYMVGVLGAEMVEGMEADDALSLAQREDTIICSRDKDLMQVPGWHYSWECGKQPSFGPFFVEGYGEISLDDKRKLKGYGNKFFLAQCLLGDRTDNILGIPKCGAVAAFELLGHTTTYEEGLEAVRGAYKGFYGDDGDMYLLENGQLLWMTRELNEHGEPVLWTI